jgi:hypothetical protein
MAIGTTLTISFDSKAVQRGLAGIKSRLSDIGKIGLKAFKVIGVAAIAGVAGVAALAVKLNSIGEAATTSENRVKNIVKQMGLFGDESGKVAKKLIDFAKITSRQLGIDEEIIQMTQAKLSTFKELAATADETGGAFDRATMAALDMAAAGFGTAETNAVQLGKALNDPIKGITALTRSGITFTGEQKNLIASFVDSGNVIKAQTMILKAIEDQVGGTASATADASAQIKASFGQIVAAFAKPFSAGFSSLPGQLEGVFEGLIEKAKKFGEIFGNAIADAVAGNYEKFQAIGELIGTILSSATAKTFKTGLRNLGAGVLSGVDAGENFIRDTTGLSKLIGNSDLGSRATSAARVMSAEDTRQMANAIRMSLEPVMQGNQGLVPGTGGRFQFAPPGSNSPLSDRNGNRVVEVLGRIEKNTAQGAKM